MQTSVSQAPAKGSVLYDPKVRGAVYQIALVAIVAFIFYEAATNAVENLQRAKIASGFGFLSNTAGFDINQIADRLLGSRLDLWAGLPGRPAQHADRFGLRHLLRDHPRLHHRHRAAVEELDRPQGRDGLCRDDPQHPAAAAAAVLVQRGPRAPAAAARLDQHGSRLLPERPRAVPAEADLRRRFLDHLDGSRDRHRGDAGVSPLGAGSNRPRRGGSIRSTGSASA